ncbi:hypothetical protein AB7849_09500 [Rhodanobacter sp. 115]|uniref:hypothetical protein n=1 Tax=Rhodanobacter sp. FW021-MT20 TaxID=1162282 RepID=UPI0034E486E4
MPHPQQLPNWTMPATPQGYDEPVAVMDAENSSSWRPDFVAWERAGFWESTGFASQDTDVPRNALPAWPWRDGFVPTPKDWQSIGFLPFV